MTSRLDTVLSTIDTANAGDPNLVDDAGQMIPAELLYGQRMTAELERICPTASEHLRIAARGQHIERWKTPRSSFPDGREGYYAWRIGQGAFHAERIGEIMAEAGYAEVDCERVGALLRKQRIKQDPEMQMLEDVICLVFLRWYFADFSAKHESEKVFRIVQKTARKMSEEGRARVAAELDIPTELAPALAV